MLIQRISRSDPERVFVVIRADEAGVSRGWSVAFNFDGTRNGIDVEQTDAVDNLAVQVGIAHTDIANGDYGLAQVYGYDDDVVVWQTNVSYSVGSPLGLISAHSCYNVVSASAPDSHSVIAYIAAAATLATSGTSTTNRIACFLRFM